MSDEIQFGDVEHAEPEVALRPDQDAHFATTLVGDLRDDELPIFVDLDVMRDMEAHALSNTRVELGGVMLGKQLIDDRGKPFVWITDCLRAEHYEATKGSFKFTHDTWSQITRQRQEFHPDLEMVGWYHTHPGWSVFLSGMDLFICDNFFNRPLDVALVIDPCEQDRGWFQWDDSQPPQTFRTGGFHLITGRFRQDELDFFARIYNKEPDMINDPRYSPTQSAGTTSVQFMDSRKSVFELAIIGMLAMQFFLLLLLGWRLMGPTGPDEEMTKLRKQIAALEEKEGRTIREQAFQDAIELLASRQTGDPDFAKDLVKLKEQEELNRANLEGQLALNRELIVEKMRTEGKLKQELEAGEKLENQLVTTRDKLKRAETRLATIAKRDDAKSAEDDLASTNWWLVSGVAMLTLGLGLGGGYLVAAKRDPHDDLDSFPDPEGQTQVVVDPQADLSTENPANNNIEVRGSMIIDDKSPQ